MNPRTPLRYSAAVAHRQWLLRTRCLNVQTYALHTSHHMRQDKVAQDEKAASITDESTEKNSLINPPASTRPPPLVGTERNKDDSVPRYAFNLAKGYLKFYNNGIQAVIANHKLMKARLSSLPAADRPSLFRPTKVPPTYSRADWVLLWRTRHDVVRLPLFAVMIALIGEMTAVVVFLVEGTVPFTCRIPKQVLSSRGKAEQRRAASFEQLEKKYPNGALSPSITRAVAHAHVLKSLHISGTIWDRLRFTPPGLWALKGRMHMVFLEGDDKLLIEHGGPDGLEPEELRIACTERGINVLDKSDAELRTRLGDWLRLTATEDIVEKRRRMLTLLLTRPENWPKNRDFALPDWEL